MPPNPRGQAPPAPPGRPPFYTADADLYLGDPEAGTLPVRAHQAGDTRVPAEHVERYGWQALVHAPAPTVPPPAAPAGGEGTRTEE